MAIGIQTDTTGSIELPGGISVNASVETVSGGMRISDLHPGDLLQSRDGLPRRIVAIHRGKTVSRVFAPSPGVLGASRSLRLCGDQPVLLEGWLIAALFSRQRVVVPIACLEVGDHVREVATEGEFCLIECDAPALIRCDGIWMASHAPDGGLPCDMLTADEQRAVGESGIFVRRRGELHARQKQEELFHAA